jgi:hypothetical protein
LWLASCAGVTWSVRVTPTLLRALRERRYGLETCSNLLFGLEVASDRRSSRASAQALASGGWRLSGVVLRVRV